MFFLLIGAVGFAFFATAVLSYIALATPIGPWIESIVVLIGLLLVRVFRGYSDKQRQDFLALTSACAGIAGIAATACAFAFPTLFFLDRDIFNSWMATPWAFAARMGLVVAAGGSLAFLVAGALQDRMLNDESMTFPVGAMTAKIIEAYRSIKKSLALLAGAVSALLFGALQAFTSFIPRSFALVPAFRFGPFSFTGLSFRAGLVPLFWSIGFIAGKILAIPLLVGIATKIFFIAPLHGWVFPQESMRNVIFAFAGGMVIQGALASFLYLPHVVINTVKRIKSDVQKKEDACSHDSWWCRFTSAVSWWELCVAAIILILFFWFFNFSFLGALYTLVFTVLCMYQVLILAGKMGLAPLGRFATFVMLPGLLIFGFDSVQVVVVSTFVGLACGIVSDIMFGRKMGQMLSMKSKKIAWFQLLGLIVSVASIGFVFWLLITRFGLGSGQLFAQRAQARALLVTAHSFNYWVILIGAVYGYVLKRFKVNAMLVFGGLVMPYDFSLMLIGGGLSSYLVKDKEAHDPFWSGVFAASSLWMLLKALF